MNKNIFHSFVMTNIEIEILSILGLSMVTWYKFSCTIIITRYCSYQCLYLTLQGLSGKDGMLGAPGERGESVSTIEIYHEKKV